VEARFSAPVRTGPEAHLASCVIGTGSLSREWSSRGVTLTTHPQLAPRLEKEWSHASTLPLLLHLHGLLKNELCLLLLLPHRVTMGYTMGMSYSQVYQMDCRQRRRLLQKQEETEKEKKKKKTAHV
jgi:hypothetical protein